MKAIIYKKYGPPSVAQVSEVPKPTPKDNEILIKVSFATVNRTDAGFRSAEYFISRFWSGLFKPNNQILGCEFSGTVEALGPEVTEFKIGDKVFGFNDKTFGGHGEYLTILETDAVLQIPTNMDLREAAAISEGAHYALADILAAKVEANHKVLVNGATGAIGSAAVQILKHFGAHVTAVCNTQNLDMVKSLSADVVIDYQNQDFTKTKNTYNFIFDAVGKSSFVKCKPILSNKGIYISTEFGKNGENIYYAISTAILGGKKLLFPIPSITKVDLAFIKKLVENKEFWPLIDRQYKMSQIVEAYEYVESGQKIGNVLIEIA